MIKDNSDNKVDNVNSLNKKIYFNEFLIILLTFTLVYFLFGKFDFFLPGSNLDFIFHYLLITTSIIGVIPVLYDAVRALIKKSITVDLLASIALFFTLFKGEWVSAVFINLMLSSARLFSAFTERRTENIISRLLKLRPLMVKVRVGEEVVEKNHNEVKTGDIIIVEAGDRVPVDGVVTSGRASIDQSSLTGESEPISAVVGSQVFSSTLCLSGSLFVRAEKVGEDTTLAKMIKLVDEASRAKTKTETLANKFSTFYIVATILAVIVIYFYTKNLTLILTMLLVTCADDLAVAIPMGFTVSISKAAKHGIVVKGAEVMERMRNIKTIVTDKTGTLTKGRPIVVKVFTIKDFKEEDVILAGAICSVDSKHPTAEAIFKFAKDKGFSIHAPDEVLEYPGAGVWAKHEGHEYFHAKMAYLEEKGIEISDDAKRNILEEKDKGYGINCVAIDGKFAGFFVLSDDLRKSAKNVIIETKSLGIKKWIMLTGDNEKVAERVSKELGIDEFHANLRPEDKIEYIKKIKKSHGDVAMIGDGVNDAASLALADVSFAMGSIGSDVSIEAADVALMHDDLSKVPEAIYLSNESIKIVKQNFIIWIVTNGIGLTLALSGVFNPVSASAYNFLTDFIPILNVFKIYRLKITKKTYNI